MSSTTIHPQVHPTLGLPRAVTFAAVAAADTIRLWRQRARDRRELAGWTERDLRDAGVSRSDLYRELAKPFWRG